MEPRVLCGFAASRENPQTRRTSREAARVRRDPCCRAVAEAAREDTRPTVGQERGQNWGRRVWRGCSYSGRWMSWGVGGRCSGASTSTALRAEYGYEYDGVKKLSLGVGFGIGIEGRWDSIPIPTPTSTPMGGAEAGWTRLPSVAAGAEHRQRVAQRVSAGFWSSRRIQPRRGRQKAWARGSVRDSVAPPGLETSWDTVPTADAVGYLLSVLRTYGTPGPLRLRGFARKPTNPADFAGSREGRRGGTRTPTRTRADG